MNSNSQAIRTRFAPSPTGFLHIGHALSALWSARRAQQLGGEFLVRIEDIDHTRRRPEMIQDIKDVLEWLDVRSDQPMVCQHERRALYDAALYELKKLDLVYPCRCTRRQILSMTGDAAAPYPGTCRNASRAAGDTPVSWRLDWQTIQPTLNKCDLAWHDLSAGPQQGDMSGWGDVIIARRDIGTSYHLAHVVDDHDQAISHVTRGMDLFDQTVIHRLLQVLLGYRAPQYDHHPLVMVGPTSNRKLSKRDGSTSLMGLVATGLTKEQLLSDLACYFAAFERERA